MKRFAIAVWAAVLAVGQLPPAPMPPDVLKTLPPEKPQPKPARGKAEPTRPEPADSKEIGPEIAAAAEKDPLLRAMLEELERSRGLRLTGGDLPYFMEYTVEDQESIRIAATMGSVLSANRNRMRLPLVNVRIGSYEFDNTNHIGAGYFSGTRYDPEQLPLDDNRELFRQTLWLATDRAFKSALESMGIKRAILRNVNEPDKLADFSPAQRVHFVRQTQRSPLDLEVWKRRVARLSGVFANQPAIRGSVAEFDAYLTQTYYVNTEGTVARYPDNFTTLRVRANGQAPDGAMVRDAWVFHAMDASRMASDAEWDQKAREMVANITALTQAPVGESYAGPVLFEPLAGAQLLAQMLGDNLRFTRKPLSDPNRPLPILASEFETRVGSRVLPAFFSVTDDATRQEWNGHALMGYYPLDLEGVVPAPLPLIVDGTLKDIIRTRQPMKGFAAASTGHARLLGAFGAKAAAVSNLMVETKEPVKLADLKKQLIQLSQQRQKPYGLLIRKLDYPYSAGIRDLQSEAAGAAQSGATRLAPVPLLVYRVYADGREELVRGLRFRGLTARALRDIVAATQEKVQFDWINNGAILSLMGSPGYLAPASIVAPGFLMDEVELERLSDGNNKLPIVPPPPGQ
jgi:hypothetical protein